MKLRTIAPLIALGALAAIAAVPAAKGKSAASAIRKALPPMQRASMQWFKSRKCISCHHHALVQVATQVADRSGFGPDATAQRTVFNQLQTRIGLDRFDRLVGTGSVNPAFSFSFALWSRSIADRTADDDSDATVVNTLLKQSADGRWTSYSHRPPIEDSEFTVTAMAIKNLRNYAPDSIRAESDRAWKRAVAWLLSARGRSNEDLAFQLAGLVWGGAPKWAIEAKRAGLVRLQRKDGGWAQLPTRDSDAYATGQAMYALALAGESRSSSAWQRGRAYMIDSQFTDGTWHVDTRRRFPGLPYFESGFPHGKDQFISCAATAWCSIALALDQNPSAVAELIDTRTFPRSKSRSPLAKRPQDDEMLRAALFGTLDDLKRAHTKGGAIDARSIGKATPLMYAIRSPEKVAWLLSNGADPNAIAADKTTPLMLAAEFLGSSQPLELLLKAGAKVDAVRDPFSSVLACAARTGDLQRVKRLLSAEVGAKGDAMAAVMAETCDEPEILRAILKSGVDPDSPVDEELSTVLVYAAMDGRINAIKVLLECGASPNLIRRDGLSPLMVAAMSDYGSTDVVELLLANGADPAYKTVEGKTALGLAEKYGHDEIAGVLRKALASNR